MGLVLCGACGGDWGCCFVRHLEGLARARAGDVTAKICYFAHHVTPGRLPVLTYKTWAGASATAPASDVQQMHLWALSPREITQLEPWLWQNGTPYDTLW